MAIPAIAPPLIPEFEELELAAGVEEEEEVGVGVGEEVDSGGFGSPGLS